MQGTTHRFNRPRPSGLLDNDLEWIKGEDYLPAVSPDRKILWQALEGLGVTVGEVYEQGQCQPIRQVILPEGWTKRQVAHYPSQRLAIYDANDRLRLHVDCKRHCSAYFSQTTMVGRYEAKVEGRIGENWGIAVDLWGVRAKNAEYRVLHEVHTNSADQAAHRQMVEHWLDEKYSDWRYPALTWELDLSWWQRRSYRSHLDQIRYGIIPVC